MHAASKEALLQGAQVHVLQTTGAIRDRLPVYEQEIADILADLKRSSSAQATAVSQALLALKQRQLEHLQGAELSPYFARCDVDIRGEKECRSLYFGKFSLPELGIYSWATPAARIRFSEPGMFSYESETGKKVTGSLNRIDQYLIAQKHIRFMATTSKESPRTLVYQEKFSEHKSEFVLPEIVERMEKAQDDIIRADAFGSFLISGPAGSGKTTLALHRIAYLLQSPEYVEHFDPRKILVLVQDSNSKQYFEGLLPSLGIVNVGISTFDTWAMELLNIKGKYVSQYGHTERERDLFAASKYQVLKRHTNIHSWGNHFAKLEKAYDGEFTDEQRRLFARQKKEKCFDRIDLTLLLRAKLRQDGTLKVLGRVYSTKADGTLKSRSGYVELQYALILIDEVQNYLAEQIAILQSCISPKTKAMTYVGDMAQQTALFTVRDWSEVGEHFTRGRKVHLDKVYRSTRQILEYIRSCGFEVGIPDGIRDGEQVQEYEVSKENVRATVRQILCAKSEVLVGIVGLQQEDLEPFQNLTSDRCKIMTSIEAQGLEFDVVIYIHRKGEVGSTYIDMLREEKRRVIRDQLYVALTRAMNELHVIKCDHAVV